MLKALIAERVEAVPRLEERTPKIQGALAALSLSMLLSSLGTSIANVGLPTLSQAFHASFQEVQWVVLAYLLSITALIVGIGRLGDTIGRRRLLLAGVFLFTVASILCGFAPTLWLLIVAAGQAYWFVLLPHELALAPVVGAALAAQALIFALLAGLQAAKSWRADLIEPRRRLRSRMAVAPHRRCAHWPASSMSISPW